MPIGGHTEFVIEGTLSSEYSQQQADGGFFQFGVPIDTGLVQIWVLMPVGRNYEYFEIIGFPVGQPELAQTIEPDTTVEVPYGSIAMFRMINPEHNYRYECRWKWADGSELGE